MASGAKSFEDPSLLDSRLRNRLQAINGVAEASPVVVGFAVWQPGSGGMAPVFVVGTDVKNGALLPWNIAAGSLDTLTESRTVAVDETYERRLGVTGVGSTGEIRGQSVRVAAITKGIRSFTTTPYVFCSIDHARPYIGLPPSKTSYFLLRLKPGSDVERVRKDIQADVAGVEALTPQQFRDRSRSFWLFGTGAGAALFAGALLGAIVGTVIIAQTLYSSTKEHLYEFATLRAIGCSKRYIYRVITGQALISAVFGFCIASLIGLAVVRFTSASAMPILITLPVSIGLFVLTVVMCLAAAIAAIVRIVRIDPAMVMSR